MRRISNYILCVVLMLLLCGCDPYVPESVGTIGPTMPSTGTTAATQDGTVPSTLPPTIPTLPVTEPTVSVTEPNHIHKYLAQVVAPGCTEGGRLVHVCQCGDRFEDSFTEPLGHEWGTWEILVAPTAQTEGVRQRQCTRCQAVDEEVLPTVQELHKHSYTQQIVMPTCTEAGYTHFLCACGYGYTGEEQPSLGHDFGAYCTNGDATCTENGTQSATCNRCDAISTKEEPGSATGHSWCDWVTVREPTAQEEGLQSRSCAACGATDNRVLEKVPQEHVHVYTAEIIAPTCTEVGYTRFQCSCGERYTAQQTQALGHSFTQFMSNADADCTRDGTKTAQCDRCSSLSTVADPGSALGHNWGPWKTIQEPTAAQEGLQERSCLRCSATDTQVLEKLPQAHEHSYKKKRIAATCTEGGYDLFTCECGDSYREETSEPKGHSWQAWVVTEDSTTTQQGTKMRTCGECAAEEYGFVELLPSEGGFVFVSWSVVVVRNSDGYVTIKGLPGEEYTIEVIYKSGPSSAKGLEPQVADENGYVTWVWHIGGRTAAGTYEIKVSGAGVTRSITFTIEA